METKVRRNPEQHRYEILVDGELAGVAEYRETRDRVVFRHTEIVPEMQGKGLADRLIRYALDDVRARAETIVPLCPYVRKFVDEHPEYADLVA